MKVFTDLYKAWCFLEEHPLVHDVASDKNMFRKCLVIDVAKLKESEEGSAVYDPTASTKVYLELWQWFPPDVMSGALDEDMRKKFPDGRLEWVGLQTSAPDL